MGQIYQPKVVDGFIEMVDTIIMKTIKNQNFWTCVIGPADTSVIKNGADYPLRAVVQQRFFDMFGDQAEICSSGWGNASKETALESIKQSFVYAVEKTCSPEPELRKLTSGELLRLITNFAKDYAKVAVESVRQNSHMNQVTIEDGVDQVAVDAVLVDFINYIAGQYGVDYGLYTVDLSGPKKEVDFAI